MIALGNITAYYLKMPYSPRKQAFNGGLQILQIVLSHSDVCLVVVGRYFVSNNLELPISHCAINFCAISNQMILSLRCSHIVNCRYITLLYKLLCNFKSNETFLKDVIILYFEQLITQSVTSCTTKDRTCPISKQ